MPLLTVGSKIPSFLLKDAQGRSIGANDLRGRFTVVYFYPRDDTPGCTMQACDFRDASRDLASLGAEVVGVSADSAESHRAFAAKHGLPFRLIVDTPDSIGRAPLAMKFGAWQRKVMYGKSHMGIARTTFLIAPDCTVVRRWDKVKPEGHVQEVVAAIRELLASRSAKKREASQVAAKAKAHAKAKAKKKASRLARP
jgi:peroxiredoxin Q/BCP